MNSFHPFGMVMRINFLLLFPDTCLGRLVTTTIKRIIITLFFAGLLSGAGYIVKSNRESGVGRVDIIMLDKKERRVAIFEIKRSKSEDAMEKDAELALSQIKEMEYGQDLDGYRAILNYGVAFYKKNVKFLSFK